jgi:hypothetical protein
MYQFDISATEREVQKSVASSYRGKVQVHIKYLVWPLNIPPDSGKVREAIAKLNKRGYREEPRHHIAAQIDQHALAALLDQNKPTNNFLDLTKPGVILSSSFKLQCLDDIHGVEVLRECEDVEDDDKWWIVDVYVDTLTNDARRYLIEEYSKPLNFNDGIIYSKIYTYKFLDPDMYAELQWWGRLSLSKQDHLRRIFKHKRLNKSLSRFISIPVLLLDLCLGVWHRIIALKLDPVRSVVANVDTKLN